MMQQAESWMREAIAEANAALRRDEVPIGCVIVHEPTQRIVGRGHNLRETAHDATAHAEVIAITQAASHYGSWRLTEAALFVTLEPCLMCAGAIVQSRIPKVYYGADDEKAGAYRSVFQVLVHPGNNHVPDVVGGIRAEECGDLLREFFRKKRLKPTNGGGTLKDEPPL